MSQAEYRFRPAKAPVMQATPQMIENETYM